MGAVLTVSLVEDKIMWKIIQPADSKERALDGPEGTIFDVRSRVETKIHSRKIGENCGEGYICSIAERKDT